MGGGVIQLVSHGIQDLYLIGSPSITFFKVIYRRHSQFASESVIQKFSSKPNFGDSVTCTISHVGDMINQVMLYVEIPSIPKFIDPETGEEDPIRKIAWVKNLGYALIDNVSIEINGSIIDRQYGEWMYIWSELTKKQTKSLDKMIGNLPSIHQFSNGKKGFSLYIPLQFWFCHEIGLSLPLVALLSSKVNITVTFRKAEELYTVGPTNSIKIVENIAPFSEGDYIEQKINNKTVGGYVTHFDYLTRNLYYTKIHQKQSFQANNYVKTNYHSISGFNPVPVNQPVSLAKEIINHVDYNDNISHRIYNRSGAYVTPESNQIENYMTTSSMIKPVIGNSFLYVDYIYLDEPERNKILRTNHEYLIDQIQFNENINVTSPNATLKLSLKHPVKAVYWVAQLNNLVGSKTINDRFNYKAFPSDDDLIMGSKLHLDGQDMYGSRTMEYTKLVQAYQHHHRGSNSGINMYSFALYPEEHQPSSTFNMSRVGTKELHLKLNPIVSSQNPAKIRLYAINYNVFRIFAGVAKLAFD